MLNSVFMREAVDRGLDMAIVNYTKIYPLYKIPEAEVELARKLIHGDRGAGDPLQSYMAHFAAMKGKQEAAPAAHAESLAVEDKLKFCIIQGEKGVGEGSARQTIEQILETALESYTPLEIINTILLDAMRTVGDLFGARKMQLPSVLDSAGVMKAAVAHLEPKMEKVEGSQKGTMVLATVKGDVHDIGKNLVDIILTNNGYKVVNLGIKQAAETIIHAAQEHRADAIGLSGLLVKSTLEMKYVIQDLRNARAEVSGDLRRRGADAQVRGGRSAARIYFRRLLRGRRVCRAARDGKAERSGARGDGRRRARWCARRMRAKAAADASAAGCAARSDSAGGDSAAAILGRAHRARCGFRFEDASSNTSIPRRCSRTSGSSRRLRRRITCGWWRRSTSRFWPRWSRTQSTAGWFDPQVVYGYFPCQSKGNDLIVYAPAPGLTLEDFREDEPVLSTRRPLKAGGALPAVFAGAIALHLPAPGARGGG